MGGCAASYTRNGFKGGYTDNHLQDNIYQINFGGNGWTSSEKSSDFALLRAAELTLENEYKYFIVLDGGTRIVSSETAGSVRTETTYDAYGRPTTSTKVNQPTKHYEPKTNLIIECFKAKPKAFHMMPNKLVKT
ncbi:MAG: hypothetical protein IPJ69_02055 [Deltaproteobacteria bacterium]|nr:MAG: hypothetical protein IPJ69_02055 [Deltaproteobacteria bacterium]